MKAKLTTLWQENSFALLSGLSLTLALLLRGYFFLRQGGQIHPDEVMQYLEPAQWKIFGYAHLSWEFEKGARNFVLSGFFSHFLRLGAWLGLTPFAVHRAIFAFNSLLSLALLPAMWRLGRALLPNNLRLAWVLTIGAAIFPVFAYFAPHSLSESQVILLATWGSVFWLELHKAEIAPQQNRSHALLAGLLFGLAFVVRYASLPLLIVPSLSLLSAPRRRHLGAFLLGLSFPVAVTALSDWYSWGFPLATFVHYVDVNVVHGYASSHGTMPWWFYLDQLWQLFRWPLLLVALTWVFALRRHWLILVATLLPLISYSLFGHKEMRFILPVLPLLLASLALGLWSLWSAWVMLITRFRPAWGAAKIAWIVVLLSLAGLFFVPLAQVKTWSRGDNRGYFTVLDYVGRQPDATGLLLGTTRSHTGGYTLLRRNIPLQFLYGDLYDHRSFNYIAASTEHEISVLSKRHDMQLVGQDQGVLLFRRKRSTSGP